MNADSQQLPLFGSDCATRCEAFAACGGARSTAPCGCAWTSRSGLRYQCHKCYLVCRERRRPSPLPGQLGELSFASKIAEGHALDQVTLVQPASRLPLFIPTYTHKYKGLEALPLQWAAADMRVLFNSRRKGPAALQPYLEDALQSRAYLRVSSSTQLLAVLNGQDWMLESFWAMPRQAALQRLLRVGFDMGTGPTYSVTALTTHGTAVPYAHHTTMLMRHHRVLEEIQAAGLCAIPNLYWLDSDRRELHRWAHWLRDNPAVNTVSRDFTATTHWSVIGPKVAELLYLLHQAGRPFHVVVVGSGRANAPRILQELVKAGHTVTLVTSAPIMKALNGVRYELDASGVSSETVCNQKSEPFHTLIKHNLMVFEDLLFAALAGTSAAQVAVRNTQGILPLSVA